MANMERGAYEPRMENVRAYDGSEDDDEQDDASRLPLLIIIALVVLSAFGGVVWLAYTQGVERGRADAPRVMVAQNLPAKTAATPYTGLKIYQQPGPAGDSNDTDTVPPPPTPLAAANPAAAGSATAEPALRPSANGASESSAAPPQSVPASAGHAFHAAPPSPPVATRAPTQLAAPSTVAAVSPTVVAPAAAASSESPLTGVLLQIGAYKSDAEARTAWKAYKASHAAAAPYRPDVKEIDLGAKGVWYRLRIGVFADRTSALGVCAKLKADGAGCLLAK